MVKPPGKKTPGSLEHQMKIASFDEPRPRGTFMGERVGGAPLDEAENYFRCDKCNGWFDARDLAWVEDHEGELPHPARDRSQ
jgi:hypothetical protein